MHERLYRAQILIEQAQRSTLAQNAWQESRSISDLAREPIRLGLEAPRNRPEIRWRKRARVLNQVVQQRAAMRRRRSGQPIEIVPAAQHQAVREERGASLIVATDGNRD